MAEAITYADLRFVKAPLKKSISGRLGPEAEAYQEVDGDGELTYENVQVPAVPGGAGLTPSGLGHRAGVISEQTTTSWSSVRSPAATRILPCPTTCLQHLLLGLLLTCLLLGVAAICLGVRFLQVSQQLQHMNRVLEATNSSLRQQLRQRITQLGQKEEDLQESRKELARSQGALQEEQRAHQAAEEQLHTCQGDKDKAEETLQGEEKRREVLEQRLSAMQDTLKRSFTCPSEDTCCLMGWTLHQKRCFYFSPTEKTWEESANHCTSLSSKLAAFDFMSQHYYSQYVPSSFSELLSGGGSDSYWIGRNPGKVRRGTRFTDGSRKWYYLQGANCGKLQKDSVWGDSLWHSMKCTEFLRYICEMAAFEIPDGNHSLH